MTELDYHNKGYDRIASDYTTRSNYQKRYSEANRDAINARKREWRKRRLSRCEQPTTVKTSNQ